MGTRWRTGSWCLALQQYIWVNNHNGGTLCASQLFNNIQKPDALARSHCIKCIDWTLTPPLTMWESPLHSLIMVFHSTTRAPSSSCSKSAPYSCFRAFIMDLHSLIASSISS
mmetsp:Transcript_4061/g.9134  ORF Transcript_4061/g.9134 Transcript_4061/m.9134 type:complete len:112 (+) Transcript_4061:1042-1377(+)